MQFYCTGTGAGVSIISFSMLGTYETLRGKHMEDTGNAHAPSHHI